MKEQKPTIGRSVHVRTEGGCLSGHVAKVIPPHISESGDTGTGEMIVVGVYTATEPPVKNVTVAHGSTTGWHWYQECPDTLPKKAAE